jgi:single-stranded-DNA-specific exonuclease
MPPHSSQDIQSRPYRRGLQRLWRPRTEFVPAQGTLVERVLASRGLTDAEAVRLFLNPSLLHLHDPSLMKDMDTGAQRLLAALTDREPVAIYGDYDVDGVTATAILYHVLKAIAPDSDVRTYVPHRIDEGYGLNTGAIEQFAADGAKVIVSVDCGVTAVDPAAAARRAGVDLIITDHHHGPECEEGLPDAHAVIHPRRPGAQPAYPFGELSGAGVAYKLAWRLASMHCGSSRVTPALRSILLDVLAFAALGTIADVVTLSGENRVLAAFGLTRIKHSPIPGLRALVEASGLAGDNIDEHHVGFVLGPRLNACGRMGHAAEAVELFTTATGSRAEDIATKLTKLNNERRATERKIADQASRMAEEAGMTSQDRRAIVLAHDDWHQGVVGIVCSRLVDRFCRPAILMARKDGECRGSGRSIEGFDLHGALSTCASHLSSFGGHAMAAGLRLDAGRLDAFADAFVAAATDAISDEQLTPSLCVDCDARAGDLTPESVAELDRLAPFGPGNPRTRLRLVDARLAMKPEALGSTGSHLKFLLKCQRSGKVLRVVAWNWGERQQDFAAGMEVEAVVMPKLSTWNGITRVEAELADLRVCESSEAGD